MSNPDHYASSVNTDLHQIRKSCLTNRRADVTPSEEPIEVLLRDTTHKDLLAARGVSLEQLAGDTCRMVVTWDVSHRMPGSATQERRGTWWAWVPTAAHELRQLFRVLNDPAQSCRRLVLYQRKLMLLNLVQEIGSEDVGRPDSSTVKLPDTNLNSVEYVTLRRANFSIREVRIDKVFLERISVATTELFFNLSQSALILQNPAYLFVDVGDDFLKLSVCHGYSVAVVTDPAHLMVNAAYSEL